MRALRIAALAVAASAALVACAKSKDVDRSAAERNKSADTAAPPPLAQPPARHHVLAGKVIAAIASGDYAQLDALRGDLKRTELDEELKASFRKLRERLAAEKIDLARSVISRVEVSGQGIEVIDAFVTYNGRMFQLHMTAIAPARGGYALLGIADWVRWV